MSAVECHLYQMSTKCRTPAILGSCKPASWVFIFRVSSATSLFVQSFDPEILTLGGIHVYKSHRRLSEIGRALIIARGFHCKCQVWACLDLLQHSGYSISVVCSQQCLHSVYFCGRVQLLLSYSCTLCLSLFCYCIRQLSQLSHGCK